MNKTNLEIAKEIIKENFDKGDCGIFDSRNICGDFMENLYCHNGLQIDICYDWAYFEVFGLTDEEFLELEDFYKHIERYEGNEDYDECFDY